MYYVFQHVVTSDGKEFTILSRLSFIGLQTRVWREFSASCDLFFSREIEFFTVINRYTRDLCDSSSVESYNFALKKKPYRMHQ